MVILIVKMLSFRNICPIHFVVVYYVVIQRKLYFLGSLFDLQLCIHVHVTLDICRQQSCYGAHL